MTVGYHRTYQGSTTRPEQSELVRKLARFGYLTKGVVYGLVGLLALLTAFGEEEGQIGGGAEAVKTISRVPFGEVLCAITGVGLIAYALWRLCEAALDLRHDGTDGKGIAHRLGYAGSGLMNGAVGVLALDIVIGSGSSGGNEPSTWAGHLMQSTLGSIVLGAIGLGFVLFGFAQIVKGWTGKFVNELHTARMTQTEKKWTYRAGKIGLIARGAVFPIIGGFLLYALLQNNPGEVRGLGGALMTIASQPYGQILLALVAFGLLCYGVYQVVFAKYGRLAGR